MRVPVRWLRALLPDLTAGADEIAAALIRAGLEVEQVERLGHDISGVVAGRVLDLQELTEFTKPIRFCQLDVGDRVHGVVCGARNFRVDDMVAVAVPGAVLPGGLQISSRQTYGRISEGMICSGRELGLPDTGAGILVLQAGTPLGADVSQLLQLREEVLDIAVTPDRGYVLSLRGVARETATAMGLQFADPAMLKVGQAIGGHPVRVEDRTGCDRFVTRTVTGLDAGAASPLWLRRRLALAGMRSISLAVDVTNYVMLELGQPTHGYDRALLQGPIVVRRAHPGERLRTLDEVDRALDPDDLVIADDSGAIGLAGVIGGAGTEIAATTTEVVIEAAHFTPAVIARAARRHKLGSEASRRFERGVDTDLAAVAAQAVVNLLVELGGATAVQGTDLDLRPPPPTITFAPDHPGRVAGRGYPAEVVTGRLQDVGCQVHGTAETVTVTPPSWRPDLLTPIDLVEEVIRLEGYDTIPVALPPAPGGRGLSDAQRLARTASRALAAGGLVEVSTPPFVAPELLATVGGAPGSPRLLNPLSEAEALLRPLLLPGLLSVALRNVSRGLTDVALYEIGTVFQGSGTTVPAPPADRRPTEVELRALDEALPTQPRHAALVLVGRRQGRAVDWADAVEAVLALGTALGLVLVPRQAWEPTWHPGRGAELLLAGQRVGLAGELHPRVLSALDLPPRMVGAEVDLGQLLAAAAARGPVRAPVISPFPPAAVDVALVVDSACSAAEVEQALREGSGPLLESLRLFDVYAGPQLPADKRSLAFALRLRAPDRTLTDTEVRSARDSAIALAGARTGAVLRT